MEHGAERLSTQWEVMGLKLSNKNYQDFHYSEEVTVRIIQVGDISVYTLGFHH